MAGYSAIPTKSPRRSVRPSYDPLESRSRYVADALWERAMKIANVLAPDNPVGQQQLPDVDQWLLLETVALTVSPGYWDQPQAILDLYRLRKEFMPKRDHSWLKVLGQERMKEQKGLPDASVTPLNPEFKKRLGKV